MINAILQSIETALEQYSAFPYMRQLLTKEVFTANVNILAIGKSALEMTQAACDVLKSQGIEYDGYLLTKYGHAPSCLPNIQICEAGHPVPDANTIQHSRDILGWLSTLAPEEDIIILLSGGGSALFEVPEGRSSLQDITDLNRYLLSSGLCISEMNEARSKLSKVKHGKALKYIACKRIFCYALSDVESNDPAVIASAPFFSAQSHKVSANYYKLEDMAKQQQLIYHIVGDNLSFINTLAKCIGENSIVHEGFINESADKWAETLADIALRSNQPGIHIFGGETPLTVNGTGKGGRCTHIALDFAIRIAGQSNINLIAYATDGSDYINGIGGAQVNGNTVKQLKDNGIDAFVYLQTYDSYSALAKIGAIIPSFPSHINVNDIFVLKL